MSRLCLCLVLMFFSIKGYSQNYSSSDIDAMNEMINSSLESVVSASPEASSLGKYGGVPVNLNLGQLNYTIPIYTIKAGDFEFPLTLSYNYNGFKLGSDPTMVGMGWTANFSGAIVRNKQGGVDEQQDYFFNGDTYENLDNLIIEEKVEALIDAVDQDRDVRPDKFVINTPTLEGAFRFTPDKEAVFSEISNYKVDVNEGTTTLNDFVVTDEKGNSFEFTESEHTENWNWDTDTSVDYNSAWMLSKILLMNSNEEISFNYKNYFSRHFNETVSRVKTGNTAIGFEGVFQSHFSNDQTLSKIIDSISFPGGYVKFNQQITSNTTSYHNNGASSDPGAYVSPTDQAKLQSVEVFNAENESIIKYVFDYYDNGYYYFLKSIKKEVNGTSGVEQEDYYSFEYLKLDQLPTKRYTNNYVDLWGFYNGVTFNPENLTNSFESDYSKGSIGALSKIIYPTKGWTKIEYESNNIQKSGTYYDSSYPVYNTSITSYLSAAEAYDSCDFRESVLDLPFAQEVKVILEVDVAEEHSYAECWLERENGSIVNYVTTSGSTQSLKLLRDNEYVSAQGEPTYAQLEGTVNLSSGIYNLRADLCQADSGNETHYAKVTVFYNSIPINQMPASVLNVDVGGIRVKNTIDFSSLDDPNPIVTNYKYVEDEDSDISSGYLTDPHPRFKSETVDVRDIIVSGTSQVAVLSDGSLFLFGGGQSIKSYTRTTESYRPMTSFTYLGSHVVYPRVEVLKDGLGKTVKEYVAASNYIPDDNFPDVYLDNAYRKGKVKKELVKKYNSVSGFYEDVQKQTNGYSDMIFGPSNQVYDCEIRRHTERNAYYNGQIYKESIPSNFSRGEIWHKTRGYLLNSSQTESIEENGIVLKESNISYDSETGYASQITTNNSDGYTSVKKIYYPNNASLMDGLSSDEQSAFASLEQDNRLSIPIQETYITKDSSNVSKSIYSKRMTFKEDLTTGKIMPEFSKLSKGSENDFEEVIEYKYYPNGRTKEQFKINGTHIVYVWGYNEQYPVAKVENSTYDEVATILGANLENIQKGYFIQASGMPPTYYSDGQMRTMLSSLRTSLPKSMVTTYTYDPLIGVTSITDSKGLTTYYEYDDFGRLETVKDAESNLLSKNEYHYQQQP